MENWLSAPSIDQDQEIIEEIAHECGRPIEEVQDVYVAERGKLESSARIKDYVPLLVSRRVRNLLHEDARRAA
jgi:hypothetical protein